MNVPTYQVRIFVDGQQVHTATCPFDLAPPAVGQTINNRWLVSRVEKKPNSGELNPPPIYGEVWIEAALVATSA